MKKIFFLLFILPAFVSCTKTEKNIPVESYSAAALRDAQKNLTGCIVQDILSPPFASRVYAYPHVAAYEVLIHAYTGFATLQHQLNGLDSLPVPDTSKVYHYELAAITAFNRVAQKLVWTEHLIASYDSLYKISIKKSGISEEVFLRSAEFGNQMGDAILKWSQKDNFKETRKMTRYVVSYKEDLWQPTPPDYLPAVEPYWGMLRPFVLSDGSQFVPAVPPHFDLTPGSAYRKSLEEVYAIKKSLSAEQKEIAKFWDCNPSVSTHTGHLAVFSQKMTPGGHWLAITSTVARNKNLDLMQTSEAFVLCAIALADGFIACWNAKYKFNTVRPVTVINKAFSNKSPDPNWLPFLQTPPFPEYPSGHSTISGSASTVLGHLLGNETSFTDSTEVEFGLPVRSFTSFSGAADEVSISRVYGGIHFNFACENGLAFGRQIGNYIAEKVKTRK